MKNPDIPRKTARGKSTTSGTTPFTVLTGLDVGLWWWRARRHPSPMGAVAYRDVAYAALFYVVYLPDTNVPALLLGPIILAEFILLHSRRTVYWVMAIQLTLISIRITYIGTHSQWLPHPEWPAAMIVVTFFVYGITSSFRRGLQNQEDSFIMVTRARSVLNAVQIAATTHASPDALALATRLEALVNAPCTAHSTKECQALTRDLSIWLIKSHQANKLFTAREEEILQYIVQGYTYGEIAHSLQLSKGTVRSHAATLMRKTDTHSRQEIVQWIESHDAALLTVDGPAV